MTPIPMVMKSDGQNPVIVPTAGLDPSRKSIVIPAASIAPPKA